MDALTESATGAPPIIRRNVLEEHRSLMASIEARMAELRQLMDKAEDLLGAPFPRHWRGVADVVLEHTARAFNCTPVQLTERSKAERVQLPRMVAIMLIRKLTLLSEDDIAKVFQRDRTCIRYACRAIDNRKVFDLILGAEIDRIERRIYHHLGITC